MSGLLQDLRFTARALRKAPTFTAVTIATLALGIGSTIAIFTVVNGVLLRPLPYARGDRLANIWVDLGVGNQSLPAVSPGDFRDYQQRSRTFDAFAAASGGNVVGASGILTGPGAEPERVTVSTVTANFFPLLGVQPMLGRQFEASEEAVNGPPAVLLSYRLWQRRFGGDPSVVGRSIELDGVNNLVAGVLPPDFRLLLPAEAFLVQDSEIWKPLQINYAQLPPRNFTFFTVFGRLKAETTYEQAQSEMSAIARALRAEHVEHESSDMRIRVVPLQQDVAKGARPALIALLGTVAFVLLIACANVAHLFLARGLSRDREMAVRTALGASRWILMRQLAVESLALAMLGGGAGLLLAYGSLSALRTFAPPSLPRLESIRIDSTVLAVTTGLCLLTALLFGLAPALHRRRTSPVVALRTGASSGSPAQARVRSLLVVAEVALSVVLLVGAGLMIRSFIGLQQVKPGFDPDGLLTFQTSLPRARYATGPIRTQFIRTLEERLGALPGVVTVGTTSQLPLTGSGPLSPYAYDEATARNWESATADGRVVSPDYFAAMKTRLLEGRFFAADDGASNRPIAIVDEMLARRAFPDGHAVGQRLQVQPNGSQNPYVEIVGVVEHIRMLDIARQVRGQIYRPLGQNNPPNVAIVIRTASDPAVVASEVRAAVHALDPNLAIDALRPMGSYVGDALAQSRFSLMLMAAFGILALVLATIGIYGVIAYTVNQRTREIGIRLALGEDPTRIRNLVVRQGMTLVGVSLLVGVPLAVAAAQALGSLLYDVEPTDPMTYAAAALVLGAAALLGCYVPARRTASVSPLLVLKSE
jgi:putative ABC transport system permease protein